MNPDNTTPDSHHGDERVEEFLRAVPCPVLPPDWRAGILKAARPPVWPWFTRPVRWGLAACWAAIGILHLTAPPGPDPLPGGYIASPQPMPPDLDRFWFADSNNEPVPPDSREP